MADQEEKKDIPIQKSRLLKYRMTHFIPELWDDAQKIDFSLPINDEDVEESYAYGQPLTRSNVMAFIIDSFYYSRGAMDRHQCYLQFLTDHFGIDYSGVFSSVVGKAEELGIESFEIFTQKEKNMFVAAMTDATHNPQNEVVNDMGIVKSHLKITYEQIVEQFGITVNSFQRQNMGRMFDQEAYVQIIGRLSGKVIDSFENYAQQKEIVSRIPSEEFLTALLNEASS